MIYETLKNRLLNQHEAIGEIIKNTPGDAIEKIPAPGKWSAKDQIAHLAKYQPVFLTRMKIILQTDAPTFERYLAENDPEFETWRDYSHEQLIQQLKADRRDLHEFILSLSESELCRVGMHKKYGKLTVVQWTEFFLLHEAHHIFSIFQLVHSA